MAISRPQQAKQLLSLGGRIGLQEGGGIEQRLEQLGGDVTSAEKMLQAINDRLQTAESSLGSGGGLGSLSGASGPLSGLPGVGGPKIPDAVKKEDPYARTILAGLSKDNQRFDSAQSAFDALAEQTRQAREKNPFTRNMIGTELFQGAEGFKNFTNLFNQINDPGFVAPSLQLASQGSSGISAVGLADGGITNRQKYGLGSFVKKITKKATKPFTKIAKKLVPKEIAGIMRVAAPFLPPGYREAAYLLGTAKQTGRLSPVDLALAAAPTFFDKTTTGQNLMTKFKGTRAGEFLLGKAPPSLDAATAGEVGTQGFIGSGGEMFQFGRGQGLKEFATDTNIGNILLGNKEGTGISMSKAFGIGAGIFSLIASAKTPDEAGRLLVAETGDPFDYERGKELFGQLPDDAFKIPDRFVLSKDGGLIRKNFALGTMPTEQEQGLGGLPIEADMRYTGGFMPYGAVEKADDVPARLSKNEFVFTADAVRAAGGGSVQKGAKRMYDTMKKLESQPEAKGMA